MFRNLVCTTASWLLVATSAVAEPPHQQVQKQYFVILKTAPTTDSLSKTSALKSVTNYAQQLGVHVQQQYQNALVGFLADIDSSQQQKLSTHPDIKKIVPNGVAYMSNKTAPYSWGIDRIDQRDLPLDEVYNPSKTGVGTHVYVVDSGIRETHEAFLNRLGEGYSAVSGKPANADCNGHGTHVAGTVGGNGIGVAQGATLHAVRVFDCLSSTTWDVVIDALDWVIANHEKPAVVNMSLGGDKNEAVDEATSNTIAAGVHVVVAAGNETTDACVKTPANVPDAITVGASTINDARAYFSNFGGCVDLFAPGYDIQSASYEGDDQYFSANGTSMASPHVAGSVALQLQDHPDISPQVMAELIRENATQEIISDANSEQNDLLFVDDYKNVVYVDAGADQYVRLENPRATLQAKASSAFSRISSGTWEQLSGPTIRGFNRANWQQTLDLEDLALGDYVFQFTATDNSGHSGHDSVTIHVKDGNIKPNVDAGPDKRIKRSSSEITLSGSAEDTDGYITNVLWEQVSGPVSVKISTPNTLKTYIYFPESGAYTFKLTATDNDNDTSSDTVTIRVNYPPVANAGPDQAVSLPTNSVQLQGEATDEDGDDIRYYWQKMSGPEGGDFSDAQVPNPLFSNLAVGTYVVRLYAVDTINDYTSDDMRIVVSAEPPAVRVDAGSDIEIRLPNNTVELSGRCTARDGKCVRVTWHKVEVPAVTAVGSTLTLSHLSVGEHVYQFTGWDAAGNSAADNVKVTVLPETSNIALKPIFIQSFTNNLSSGK